MSASDSPTLREEIAAIAARMIAEDGLDYAGAKRRAAREVLGDSARSRADCMPDNQQVEEAVREHQALFLGETQPVRLLALRRVARDVMRFLDAAGLGLTPYVTGAVVNGTAGEHSDIHLQVFDDNAKDLEIHLLNAGIEYEASEHAGGRGGELLSFLWPQRGTFPHAAPVATQEAVHLAILDPRDNRGQAGERADLRALEALIEANADPAP